MALRASQAAPVAVEEATIPTVSPSKAAREAMVALEHRGRLTAAAVVDSARDPQSPLHRYFEWDDTSAAESWRLEQARSLIRSVRVIVTYETETLAHPRYVRDTKREPDEPGYVTIDQCKREPSTAKALMRYEFGRAAAHVQRAIGIAEAIGLDDEAKSIAASIERLLRKLA